MFSDNLFGEDFPIDSIEETNKLLKKAKEPKKAKTKKVVDPTLALHDKLLVIEQEVNRILGKHKEDTLVIYNKEDYLKYIDSCIAEGICAVDTETNNSTEPITCKLMGLCLYTNNQKQVYIPCNHVNINTGERLPNQLKEEDIREGLQKLVDNDVKLVFHNATFDIRVIQCQCHIKLKCYWDTRVACRILDENESSKSKSNLKYQYRLHIDPTQEKYDIESLFQGLEYAIIDPQLFALYAATDPFITMKLYEWQLSQYKLEKNKGLYNVITKVEIPEINVVKDMELIGISIDKPYWERLKKKYDSQLNNIDERIEKELLKLKPQIDAWRQTPEANYKPKKTNKKGDSVESKSKSEQLSDPINLGSPSQFAILLYDIIKVPVVDKSSPRGTGEEIIDAIYEQTHLELCKLLIERRGCLKILSSYIDNIPPLLDIWNDGKIRVGFDQNGTDTGRFTSGGDIKFLKDGKHFAISGVNLQTIPSHNKEIRMLYKASDGYVIIGSDYSAQEPRITAFMSQDENMLQAYKDGKDLYAVIASLSFDKPYEECLEFNPITGAKQVEGKERRSQAKTILLGLEYGRGAASIGEQLGKSKEEAQLIIDRFFKAFPKVEKWIKDTHEKVKRVGYVEDWLGRQRKLPNINLPKYEFYNLNEVKDTEKNFNPLFGCSYRQDVDFENKVEVYKSKLAKAKWGKQVKEIILEAKENGVEIKNNSNLIAEAERQSVNAIIQGGAATLTKLAMINIYNDEVLNKLGFRLLSTIHDEVFGECPEKNAQEVATRLTQVMIDTAKPYMNVPMSCDAYVVKNWYEDEYKAELLKELKDYINKDKLPKEVAFNKLVEEHSESTIDNLKRLLGV